MKKVYICSPYKGDKETNTKETRYYAGIAAHCNAIPIAPHLYFPQFLDDDDPSERMLGISLGIELLKVCDELWLFGFKITEGMKFELDKAVELKLPICLYDEEMKRIEILTIPVDDRLDSDYRELIKSFKLLK